MSYDLPEANDVIPEVLHDCCDTYLLERKFLQHLLNSIWSNPYYMTYVGLVQEDLKSTQTYNDMLISIPSIQM